MSNIITLSPKKSTKIFIYFHCKNSRLCIMLMGRFEKNLFKIYIKEILRLIVKIQPLKRGATYIQVFITNTRNKKRTLVRVACIVMDTCIKKQYTRSSNVGQ